jgi:4-amino-4-deoxy-L-arabinose transferase-like glycosyltransferase
VTERRFLLAIAGLAALAGALAIAFVWQPGLASIYDDSVSYLVMGQVMSPWMHASAAVADAFPLERYPPLFPLLLGITGGAFDWRVGHALVAACFAASVFLCALHARGVTGSRAMAAATALAFALLPGTWMNLKGILTEFPYLAFSLAALVQHRRLEGRGSARGWAALAALLAAAILTRTVGIALVAGLAAAEAVRWRRTGDAARLRSAAIALAVPVAAAALWYLLRPAGREDTYAAIGAGMLASLREEGAPWLVRIALANAASFGYSWLRALLIFWSDPWQPKALFAAAIGLLGVAGLAGRALRAEADALYALFYLGILLFFPFPAHMYRLGLPIVPVVLAAGWWVLREASLRSTHARIGRYAAALSFAPLAVCVPAMLFVAERALTPAEPGERQRRADIAEFYRFSLTSMAASIADREIAVFDDLEHIRATTPPSARVMWYLPDYVALLAGRTGIAVPDVHEPAAFAAELARRRADYVYVNVMRMRDEGTGGEDPLALARLAAAYGDPVWTRRGPGGEPAAGLLKVDPGRLEGRSR